MDSMLEQLWTKFLSSHVSVNTSIEANSNNTKKRALENLSALISANDSEKALTLLIELILSTPVWNPNAVTTIIKKLTDYLVLTGQYDDAVVFAEQGLQWDPFHPELIANICKCTCNSDPEKATKYWKYLKNCNYSEDLITGFTIPEIQVKNIYSPDIKNIRKSTNDDVLNLLIFQQAALHRRPLFESIDALRSHALSCLSVGNLHMALVSIKLALFRLKDPLYISGLNPSVIQLKKKWSSSIEMFVLAELESNTHAKDLIANNKVSERLFDRRAAVEDLVTKSNVEGLFCFVMDPAPEISFMACQYLIELGKAELVREYVVNASELESTIRDVYGELKPRQLLRLLPAEEPKKNEKKKQVKEVTDVLSDNEKTDTAEESEVETERVRVVKKAVKKRVTTEDEEDEKPKTVKKKSVAKKVTKKKTAS